MRFDMPVRSLSSSVLKWPDKIRVAGAVADWAREQRHLHPELVRLGYFGSYARGDWGVGSDLDLIAIVTNSKASFEERSLGWNLEQLPVPADMLVYTQEEWHRLQQVGERFAATIQREATWL